MLSRILIFFLLALSSNAFCSAKVLWWNIGYNEYSIPSTQNPGQSNLDDSLQSIDWNQYDIVAFGEYIPKTLNENSLDEIKCLFPYQKILKYNDAYGKSLYIFSKKKFSFKVSNLDWTNPNDSVSEQLYYKRDMTDEYGSMATFERRYIRITLKLRGKKYNFVFFHLNNPWVLFKKHDGVLKVGYELLFGKSNPLYNQILNLKQSLKKDLGSDYKRKNLILMGDSNCPRRAKGITPVCYKRMREILPVVLDKKKEITFPAKGSVVYGKLPKVKIDHVQASKSIKSKARVINYVGSDHKAVEVSIN